MPQEFWSIARQKVRKLAPVLQQGWVLALLPAAIYLLTRLWGITDFPHFFFSDEVNNVLFGEEVLQHGGMGRDGTFLPVYFEWDHQRWAPVLPVYLHGLSAALFGKSVLVARATTCLISFLGVIAIAILLAKVFEIRLWWSGISFLTIIPAWFLYSRTTFETVVGTAFFASFLLFYGLYRLRSGRWIHAVALSAACAFYSYSNQQLPMVALSLALLIVDLRYHRSQGVHLLRVIPLLLVLAVPFMDFQLKHPGAYAAHLRSIQSYWFEPAPLNEKIGAFGHEYLQGLSPWYWFSPSNGESEQIPNQHFPNLGNLGWYTLPFFAIGLIYCFLSIREAAPRMVILSMLVIPLGAAVDEIEIPRVLAFVVPAAILCALGLEQIAGGLDQVPRRAFNLSAQLGLILVALAMLRTALVDGKCWVTRVNPGLKEFAVREIFEQKLPELLRREPRSRVILSTTWANNVVLFPRFFLDTEQQSRISLGHIPEFCAAQRELHEGLLFVASVEEFQVAKACGLFASIEVVDVIEYPQGEPAIYFARFQYVADVDQIFQQLEVEKRQLVSSGFVLEGVEHPVRHSWLSAGIPQNVFDGDVVSFVRGEFANPFQFEISFPEAKPIRAVTLTLGAMADYTLRLRAGALDGTGSLLYEQRFQSPDPDTQVRVVFSDRDLVFNVLSIEILQGDGLADAQIHLMEIELQ